MTELEQVRALFLATRALIDTPEKWSQGNYTRDRDGNSTEILSPETCRWCLSGALMCADVEPMHHHTYYRAENILRDAIEGKTGKAMTIVGFNDHPKTTHAEVLAVLDAASERVLPAAA